ncbi:FHA domain-containing protein [Dactylosporangium sp. NPDC005572]|uniref:FHA domain-containing protein n=1 Tax=Dactylosporangium sp. NPDC005572 TaxID=3156889 RepID=UPI0033A1353E
MRVQVWSGSSPLQERNLREWVVAVPDEPELTLDRVYRPTGARVVVGRSEQDCDIVLDDRYVSRRAIVFTNRGGAWYVEWNNANHVEHRPWAEGWRVATEHGEARLGAGEHAFLLTGGLRRERAFCVLVSIDDATPRRRVGSGEDTPLHDSPAQRLGANLERFCLAYQQFLIWPPLRRPEVISDPAVKQQHGRDPAHALAEVIKYAIGLGYDTGDKVTARRADLAYFLAANGVLDFDQHAIWRR